MQISSEDAKTCKYITIKPTAEAYTGRFRTQATATCKMDTE